MGANQAWPNKTRKRGTKSMAEEKARQISPLDVEFRKQVETKAFQYIQNGLVPTLAKVGIYLHMEFQRVGDETLVHSSLTVNTALLNKCMKEQGKLALQQAEGGIEA